MSDDDVILIEDIPERKSVSCEQIPELFLDKLIAKKHFGQFGKIKRFILRPKRYSCTVEYESQEAAKAALARGGVFRDVKFSVFWTTEKTPGPGTGRAQAASDGGYVDSEVQQELDSMSGGPSSLRVARQSSKQSIESFLKKTERFPAPPVVAPPKQLRMPPKAEVVADPKVGQARVEFESIARKSALTAEDRYRVLEARDKYIRLTTDRTTDIKKARSTQGVCEDMCPEKERYMRECKLQVASYEAGESSQQMDHERAIKQYSRSSADQDAPLAQELRTEKGLGLSMSYLLHRIVDICDDESANLSDWFHYVWDRTRSIRKDITQQELCSPKAVQLVEQCARFHIHCAARLVAEEPSVFDQKINTENMTKCLQSLKYMYHDLALKGIRCRNEAEFRAYVVLLNLNDGNFLWEVKQLAPDILHSKEIRFALQVYFALENNNYVKFFNLVRQTTYMNACILLRYFNQIRTRALETILRAYTYRTPASLSLEHLTEILGFEDCDAAASFLMCYGLPVEASLGSVLMDPKQYERPELPYQLERALNLVESKRISTVGEEISGEPLDDELLLDNHQLEDSFDSSGCIKEEILQKILKQGKQPVEFSSPSNNDDDKVFKVPSPTTVSPKPLFPKPTSLFQPSRFTSRIETNSPAPIAPSVFSRSSPTPLLSGITPLSKPPQQPDKAPAVSFGSNIFGSVPFEAAAAAQPVAAGSIFGGFQTKSSSADMRSIFERPAPAQIESAEQEQARKRQEEEREEQLLRSKLLEDESKRRQQQEELRRKREADEERMRQELITRKEEEIRRLKQLEEEGKRQLEATLDKVTEKILGELMEEVCLEEVKQIGTSCLNEYQLLERYPKKLLEELQEEHLAEFLEETILKELLVKNCQENRQMNVMRKYFRLWRGNVRSMIDNREQIENSPLWIPERKLQDQARECYEKHQALSLSNMKRYLGGVPKTFNLPEQQKETVDIFEIVRKEILPKQKYDAKGFISNHIYWKLSISIPFKQEEDSSGFYYFISKWLKNVFKRSTEESGKCFFLEARESKASRERLTVCIRLLKGVSILDEIDASDLNALDNSAGLIFFMNPNNVQKSRQRLHNLLQTADSWGPIPLTIIAYNFVLDSDNSLEELLDIDTLLEEGKLSDFEIHYHQEKQNIPLKRSLHKSLSFLASSFHAESALEMQSQTAFIGTCLGEELWHRFRLSSDQNPALSDACRDISFVTNLFNQAVDRVSNLAQHNLAAYPDFPAEFKPFVSKCRFDIPQDLEYFPKDWRNIERQRKLVRFFSQLKLKPPTFDQSSIKSIPDLEAKLRHYIQTSLPKPNEKTSRRLLALVMQEIFKLLPSGVPFPQALPTLNWLAPITILSNELLRTRWSEAILQLPCEVIYHKQEYESYTRTLWWLPELKKIIKRPSKDHPNHLPNGEQADSADSLDGAAEAIPAMKRMKLNISLAKDDLEEILAHSLGCLERAEQKLTQCREFTQQTKQLAKGLDEHLYEQERAFRTNRWTWEENFR